MKWLFQQLEGPVYVAGWEEREDCTVVDIPSNSAFKQIGLSREKIKTDAAEGPQKL